MLTYKEHKVKADLAAYIKKIWVIDNSKNENAELGKAVLPNGCFNIAVVIGKGATIITRKSTFHLKEGIYFCGQMTKSVLVDICPSTKISIVQLFAWSPSQFTSLDMSLYTDSLVEMNHASQPYITNEDSLTSEQEIEQCIDKIIPRIQQLGNKDFLIKRCCEIVLENRGGISVQVLVTCVGSSIRIVQKKFKKAVGLSPKQYITIVKLRETVNQLAYPEETAKPFLHLAVDNNYFDQAHFNHTFKSVIKVTPNKFDIKNYFLSFKEE